MRLIPTSTEPEFDEFEQAIYARCSDNNMPRFATFVPLTEDEQQEAERALALG